LSWDNKNLKLLLQVKQREKELVEWAADLQNQLEESETFCYKLVPAL